MEHVLKSTPYASGAVLGVTDTLGTVDTQVNEMYFACEELITE